MGSLLGYNTFVQVRMESEEVPKPCGATTRKGTRCKRSALPVFRRCWQHGFTRDPYFATIALLVSLFGVALTLWLASADSGLEKQLRRIDQGRSILQIELDKEKRRGVQLIRGVAEIRAEANTAHRYAPNPEVRRLADRLDGLLSGFETDFGDRALSKDDDVRVRLAAATVANSRHLYREAEALVPEALAAAEYQAAKSSIRAADAQTDRAVDTNQVRGDTLYRLYKWGQALRCYERILELRPDRWKTRHDVAMCLTNLGRFTQSLDQYNKVEERISALDDQDVGIELSNALAGTFINRGLTLGFLGRFDEAIADQGRAIEIATQLVQQAGGSGLKRNLAAALTNRGGALRDVGNFDRALEDHGKAVELLTGLVVESGYPELRNELNEYSRSCNSLVDVS